MTIDLSVDADLEFSVDIPGQRTLTGALTGTGKDLELTVSHPFLFAGRSDSGAIRGLAEGLARQGLTVTVASPAGPLVTLGARRTPWWQRRLTGSRHIRLARGAGLWSLLRGRTSGSERGRPARPASWPRRRPCGPSPPTFRRGGGARGHHHARPERGGHPRLIWPRRRTPAPARPEGLPAPRGCHHHRLGPGLRHRARRARPGPRRGPARRGGRVRPGRPQRGRPVRVNGAVGQPLAAAHGVPRRARRVDAVVLPRGVRRPRAPVRRPARRRDRSPASPAAAAPCRPRAQVEQP